MNKKAGVLKMFEYTKLTELEKDKEKEDPSNFRKRLPSILKNFEASGNKKIRDSISDLSRLLEKH